MNAITPEKNRAIALIAVLVLAITILSSCDLRSGIAKEEGEKLNGTPTPSVSPTPTPAPINPADIIQVDTSQDGDQLAINGDKPAKTLACVKYNPVKINGDSYTATITGACHQITINGDNNKIIADAALVFVINGDGNEIRYLKFVNGQQPSITNNGAGNIVEKIIGDDVSRSPSNSKPATDSARSKSAK